MSLPSIPGYRVKRYLGGGAFGKVYLADDLAHNREVAIKRINKERHAYLAHHEINALRRVDHPNIIKLFDVVEDERCISMVMEFAQCGDIYDYVARGMREDVARMYFRQLVDALEHLHQNGICHRDLKLENILLDRSYQLKMCDFGISHDMEDGRLLKTLCGTPTYLAPEVFSGRGYNGQKADIWAAGVLLCVFLSAELPIEDRAIDSDPLFYKLKRGIFDYDPWVTTLAGPPADLCQRMLDPNPTTRANWAQVKAHPWYIGHGPILPPIVDLMPYMNLQREISMEDTAAASQQSDLAAVYASAGGSQLSFPGITDELPGFEETSLPGPTIVMLPASETPEAIIERLEHVLRTERQCELKITHKPLRLKVKVPGRGASHVLSIRVNFFRHRKGGIVVQFVRSKGEIIPFRRLFAEIRPSLE